MNRVGEKGLLPIRQSRFFEINQYWYYRTREGIDIGPYDSEEDARRGSAEFVDYVLNQNPEFVQVLSQYRPAA